MFFKVTESDYFAEIDEDRKNKFRRYLSTEVEPIPGVAHMNILTLTFAAFVLWDAKGRKLSEKEIKKAVKGKARIRAVDFVRYMRFLQKFAK
jgi:hypothetical protein